MSVEVKIKLSPKQAGKLYMKSLKQEKRIKELEALIKEAADYLDTNELTTIASSSVLHRKFRKAV